MESVDEKKISSGGTGLEEVREHIEQIKDRIIDILVDEKCPIVAAEMILRGVYDKLLHTSVVSAGCDQ